MLLKEEETILKLIATINSNLFPHINNIYNPSFSLNIMEIYSHSRIAIFERCPLRFKYRYIDKIKPEFEKTIEAHLGTAVHNTLEWIYTKVNTDPEWFPKIDEVIEKFTEQWQKNSSDELLIVKKDLTARDYFNKGIQFLIDYYSKHQPFKDGTIECEKGVLIELDEQGKYKIQGFIDRLVYNLEKGEYEVHDYKTAKTLPRQEELDKDRQLALYAIAVKNLYGQDKEVTLVWHFLAHNKIITSKRTNEQLVELKKHAIELIKKIESTTEFPAKRSILCDWCEFKGKCTSSELKENFPNISKYIKD